MGEEQLTDNAACAVNDYIQFIGPFTITRKLASGSNGDVYEATHTTLGQERAIKVLKIGPPGFVQKHFQRFKREAELASKLDHPNIATVYQCDVWESSPYIVLELIQGKTLDEILKSGHIFTPERAIKIGMQIALALDHAHTHNVLHRDLKPANIMLLENNQAKILDFGIGCFLQTAVQQRLTQTGELIGTPLYMAPEQCRGDKLDQRVDIYALGCVLFELLTGDKLFGGDSHIDVMLKHLHETIEIRHGLVPRAIADVISKAVSRDPDQRYQTALEMKTALSEVDLTEPFSKNSLPKLHVLTKSVPRNTFIVLFSILAIALVLGPDTQWLRSASTVKGLPDAVTMEILKLRTHLTYVRCLLHINNAESDRADALFDLARALPMHKYWDECLILYREAYDLDNTSLGGNRPISFRYGTELANSLEDELDLQSSLKIRKEMCGRPLPTLNELSRDELQYRIQTCVLLCKLANYQNDHLGNDLAFRTIKSIVWAGPGPFVSMNLITATANAKNDRWEIAETYFAKNEDMIAAVKFGPHPNAFEDRLRSFNFTEARADNFKAWADYYYYEMRDDNEARSVYRKFFKWLPPHQPTSDYLSHSAIAFSNLAKKVSDPDSLSDIQLARPFITKKNTGIVDYWCERAQRDANHKNYNRAFEALEIALKLTHDPFQRFWILNQEAGAWLEAGDWRKTLTCCQRMEETNLTKQGSYLSNYCLFDRGRAYLLGKQYSLALSCLTEANIPSGWKTDAITYCKLLQCIAYAQESLGHKELALNAAQEAQQIIDHSSSTEMKPLLLAQCNLMVRLTNLKSPQTACRYVAEGSNMLNSGAFFKPHEVISFYVETAKVCLALNKSEKAEVYLCNAVNKSKESLTFTNDTIEALRLLEQIASNGKNIADVKRYRRMADRALELSKH